MRLADFYLGKGSEVNNVPHIIHFSKESESIQHYNYQHFLPVNTYNHLVLPTELEITAKAKYERDEYKCVLAHGHANTLSLPTTILGIFCTSTHSLSFLSARIHRDTAAQYSAKYLDPSQQLNNGAGNTSKPTQLPPSPPSRRASKPDLQIRVGRPYSLIGNNT